MFVLGDLHSLNVAYTVGHHDRRVKSKSLLAETASGHFPHTFSEAKVIRTLVTNF